MGSWASGQGDLVLNLNSAPPVKHLHPGVRVADAFGGMNGFWVKLPLSSMEGHGQRPFTLHPHQEMQPTALEVP